MIPLVVWISLLFPPCTINGTPGIDGIIGTERRDVICAGAGNDIIDGAGGNDVIIAGAGHDRVDAGYGRDVVYLGPGNDTALIRDRMADVVYGGPGNDVVVKDAWDTKLFTVERIGNA